MLLSFSKGRLVWRGERASSALYPSSLGSGSCGLDPHPSRWWTGRLTSVSIASFPLALSSSLVWLFSRATADVLRGGCRQRQSVDRSLPVYFRDSAVVRYRHDLYPWPGGRTWLAGISTATTATTVCPHLVCPVVGRYLGHLAPSSLSVEWDTAKCLVVYPLFRWVGRPESDGDTPVQCLARESLAPLPIPPAAH